ncbi:MAG TPA: serine/threonine-protein kinase, partial [Kofleriaceae bacterium]
MLPTTEKGQTGPLGRVDPSLPQVFGRYLLVQRLSRGGMGEIFLAKHGLAGFEKLAVIKKVLPHLAADDQFISRFVDEAQVAIKLQHVNVAQVFEVGRVGDEYFLALEYVEGRDLRRTLAVLQQRSMRLPVDLALFVGRELANGLAYAHRRTSTDGASLNLVHCDVSPPNVLVSFEGETKVIDFGIAKSALRGTATDPKMGFGKFGYMAPEQLIRGGVVDHRTDIYAAGVVLFELLTGQRLYEAGPEPDYRALAKKVAKGEHKMPSEVDRSLAPYDDLVATALRPKPEDRYQSAAEFRDAIQQALVNVNPTISTDALGAYMRDLFQHEMNAQKELHERIAKTHLEDFQDQLTTQVGSTISFALANLPLQAPSEPQPPKLPTRSSGAMN